VSQTSTKFDGVFEGGGVKGIGLVGALSVLEAKGFQPGSLAGTSAGAIVATLCAAGYTATELKTIIGSIDFNRFKDTSLIGRVPIAGPVINLLTQLGIYQGDYFLKLMQDLLAAKGIRAFGDLLDREFANDPRYRFRLRVVASDLSRGVMLVLPQDIASYGVAPEALEVALAVRMSMSIPFFFKPVRLKNQGAATSYVVDGGVLSNFPVELFDSADVPAWPTFGFRLVQPGPPPVVRHDVGGPLSLLAAMFATAMEAHDARYIETHNFVRTIAIDSLGIGATAFDLTGEQKEALFQSGVAAATEFLQQWDFEAYKRLYRSGRRGPTRRELAASTRA